jgi:outer membrane protein OmpA-like peptidoglycan-associated protein
MTRRTGATREETAISNTIASATALSTALARKLAFSMAFVFPTLLFASTAILIAGCGRAPSPSTYLRDFDSYERDAKSLGARSQAAILLQMAEAKRDSSRSQKGSHAVTLLERAIADARVAVATAGMDAAIERADRCSREAEGARQRWEEMIVVLEQTEHVAMRTASEIPREIPVESDSTADLPASVLVGTQPPPGGAQAIQSSWNEWTAAASRHGIATGDLQARFDSETASATSKTKGAGLYLAGRTLQEIELRVRAALAERSCGRSARMAAHLGQATDAGLRASIEMERGLKSDLHAELDRVRADAEDRQKQLYGAMSQLEGKFARITQEARGTIVSLPDVLFDFDQATLKRDVEFNLVKVATILNQFPEMRIQVEGHTDNIGSPDYNLDLSQRRAQAVHDFLVSQGVAAERMTVQGYGMTRPVADNGTDEGRAKNRRVDLVIQEKP